MSEAVTKDMRITIKECACRTLADIMMSSRIASPEDVNLIAVSLLC